MISHGRPRPSRHSRWPEPTESQLRVAREYARALVASQQASNELREAVTRLLVHSTKAYKAEDKSYAIEDAVDLILADRHPEE